MKNGTIKAKHIFAIFQTVSFDTYFITRTHFSIRMYKKKEKKDETQTHINVHSNCVSHDINAFLHI